MKSFQVGGDDFPVIQGLNIPFTDVINIKSTSEVMMFGRGSAFHAPPQIRGIVQGLAGRAHETLYSFNYSRGRQLRSLGVTTNKRREVESPERTNHFDN